MKVTISISILYIFSPCMYLYLAFYLKRLYVAFVVMTVEDVFI